MHLIIFIGLMIGRGTRGELFFFLVLKTLADLAMHVISQVNWKTGGDPGWVRYLKRAEIKSNKHSKRNVEDIPKTRRTLKQRLKIWFLLGWVGFFGLVLVAGFVMQEFAGMSRKREGRNLSVHERITGTEIEFWDQARLKSEDKIEWCEQTADGSHVGKTVSINGNAAADSFRVLCDGFGPDVYPDHKIKRFEKKFFYLCTLQRGILFQEIKRRR